MSFARVSHQPAGVIQFVFDNGWVPICPLDFRFSKSAKRSLRRLHPGIPKQSCCFSINWEVAPTKEAVLVNWTGVRSVLSRQFRKGWGNRPRVSAFPGSKLDVFILFMRRCGWLKGSWGLVCGRFGKTQGQLQPSNLWELGVSGTSRGSLGTRQIHIVPSWVEAAFRRATCKSPGTLVILPARTRSSLFHIFYHNFCKWCKLGCLVLCCESVFVFLVYWLLLCREEVLGSL